LELKQLTQLLEQGTHCRVLESGKNPLEQLPTQTPLEMY
jgi:hypothetical protein